MINGDRKVTYTPQQTLAIGIHPRPHSTWPISQDPVARTLIPARAGDDDVEFVTGLGNEGSLARGIALRREREVMVLRLTIFSPSFFLSFC